MYNKKAQSQIITTILIILLVLAAIIIVWQVIQGTVEDGADEIESQTDCLGLRVDITNIDTGTSADNITARATKEISGYRAYVEGAEYGAAGTTTVNALDTILIEPETGQAIAPGDEIEVIAQIGEAACPGVKKTAE